MSNASGRASGRRHAAGCRPAPDTSTARYVPCRHGCPPVARVAHPLSNPGPQPRHSHSRPFPSGPITHQDSFPIGRGGCHHRRAPTFRLRTPVGPAARSPPRGRPRSRHAQTRSSGSTSRTTSREPALVLTFTAATTLPSASRTGHGDRAQPQFQLLVDDAEPGVAHHVELAGERGRIGERCGRSGARGRSAANRADRSAGGRAASITRPIDVA